MKSEASDKIYSKPRSGVTDFAFDDQVADVFSDMIARSVPGYQSTIATIGVLAERFATPGSNCYDLGCSLGAATLAMRHNITHDNCNIIAIDNSAAMVNRCRKIIARDHSSIPVEIMESDLRDVTISNASVVVMNFTLQFIDATDRQSIIEQIFDGLLPGGILILSEKISFSDSRVDKMHIDLHHAYKRTRGYSDLEIAQKRTALENVLVPDTLTTHKQRMGKSRVLFL